MRVDVARWRKQGVPLDQVDTSSAGDDTRRVAALFEQLPGSTVLDLGYTMGESLIVAAGAAPDRVGPLVVDLAQFSDAEILGRSQSPRASDAMQARQALAVVVRDVVKDRPKSGGEV